jgi:hypothetical protein
MWLDLNHDQKRSDEMSEAARSMNHDELDGDAAAADAERFLGEFRRNMAEQGLIVNKVARQAGWVPGLTLSVTGDELSAIVIRMRRGELVEEADERSGTES